jgi:ABC-type ATPase involved in cell division
VGTTIVLATHDASLLEAFEYPTIYLRDGQLTRSRR